MEGNDFKIITRHDRRILKELLPLGKPLSVFLEPTNLCNFRCTACVHGHPKTRSDLKPFRHMDIRLFEKIVAELRDWEGPPLRLLRLAVLGEPLLHPQILEMIQMAKEARIADRVDTFSNGSLLTEEMSEKLVDSGLDHIRFSVYSVIQERHKEVTRSNLEITTIHRNISSLRAIRDKKGKSKPHILVKMFDAYGGENDIFFEMYGDIADEVSLEKVHNATRYSGINLVREYYHDSRIEQLTQRDYHDSLHRHTACPRPFLALVVSSAGDVLLCTHDAPRATKVGDVNQSSLQSIWEGKELFEFRKMHLLGRKHENILCKNCDWYRLFPVEDNVDGFPVEKLIPKGLQEK